MRETAQSMALYSYTYMYILMFSVHVVIKFQGGIHVCQGGISRGSPLCIKFKPCIVCYIMYIVCHIMYNSTVCMYIVCYIMYNSTVCMYIVCILCITVLYVCI